MTSLFKRVLLTLSVAMLLSLPISGQDKHFEHNIYIGLGGAHSFEGEDDRPKGDCPWRADAAA